MVLLLLAACAPGADAPDSDGPALIGDAGSLAFEPPWRTGEMADPPAGQIQPANFASLAVWDDLPHPAVPHPIAPHPATWRPAAAGGAVVWSLARVALGDDPSSPPVAKADTTPFDAANPLPPIHALAVRSGWWGVDTDGSKNKVGEWQDLKAAPFWDMDGLSTDGQRTLDFSATGLDAETTQSAFRFYGPLVSVDVEYQRFLHRLDHDPLSGFVNVTEQQPGGDFFVKEDLNAGQDYAIRVQELKANFKGRLTKNIHWRLNIWGMRKKGDRQVTALAHCFNVPNGTDSNGNPVTGPVFGRSCHLQSQGQRIDWLTTEIQPVVEAKLGSATVEYSRTMRTFSQADQQTTRPYDNFGFSGDLPFAAVPDNYTYIDRLKLGVGLRERLDFYGNVYTGNTLNRFRDTNRRFRGFDARITDWSIDGLTFTGYAKEYVQTGQTPTHLLPEEDPATIRRPINYDRTTAGVRTRWRPFHGSFSHWNAFSISSGYEYRGLGRKHAVFTENATTVDEAFTTSNWMHVKASMRWSPTFDSFVRYRLGFINEPLFGIAKNGVTNSALPTQAHLVEFGGTWTPVDHFLLSTTIGLENRWNKSQVADFSQDSYPIVLTAWYAPATRWSVSGGLAFFSSWIDQDITLGQLSTPATTRFGYGSQSDVVNLGTTYAWSDRLTLTGGFEFVRGRDRLAPPSIRPDLPQFSNVVVEVTRWTAGLDYRLGHGMSGYLRYQYFDYSDETQAFNSGTTNMILGGINAVF